MKTIKHLRIASLVLYTIGVVLLLIFDWKIFIALFFIQWGDNIANRIKQPEFMIKTFFDELKIKKDTSPTT